MHKFLTLGLLLVFAACTSEEALYVGGEVNNSKLQRTFNEQAGMVVFFNTDSITLEEGSKSTLQAQANWLAQNEDIEAVIEGHADERGTRDYNLALGEERAQAVMAYLIDLGIAEDRLRTISYGKERPVDLRSTPEAWAKNRRAVTVLD